MLYNNAVKQNLVSFIFESRTHSISYAKGVIDLSVKAEEEYDKYIDDQAEAYAEWQAEIIRGK